MFNKTFIDPKWQTSLEQAGYSDFDSWWKAEGELVEEGNFRGKDKHSSWSNVVRIQLPDGRTIYLKRQQNHFPNHLLLKFRRVLTFRIEWRNFKRLRAAGVPTMNVVYFSHRKRDGDRQCVLVSEGIKGMSDIEQLVAYYEQHVWPPRQQRIAILSCILKLVKKMHAAGIIHNALYGRHIYLNIPFVDGAPVIPDDIHGCLIDLERAKYPGTKSPKLIYRDLLTMLLFIPQWPTRDRLWFYKNYLGLKKLTPEAKEMARDLLSRTRL